MSELTSARVKMKRFGFAQVEWLFVKVIIDITLGGIGLFPFFSWILQQTLHSHDIRELAERGKIYVIWNSVFDMLAWAFVALTFVFQIRDSRMRDKQFSEQLLAQQCQSVFFPYLTLFQSFVEEHLTCGNIRGRDVFLAWKSSINSVGMGRVLAQHGEQLRAYHDRLEGLLRFISNATITPSAKLEYLRILNSILSPTQRDVARDYCKSASGLTLTQIWDKLIAEIEAEIHEAGLSRDFLFESKV